MIAWRTPPSSARPTAVGFELGRFDGFVNGGWTITVYDESDLRLADFAVAAPGASEPSKGFVGFACDAPIGRINIFDEAGPSLDAVDDIQIWRQQVAARVAHGRGVRRN